MRVETEQADGGSTSLYASQKKIYPAAVSGTFRNLKWAFMAIALGVYYFLPFVRWDRGPGAPDQAVLIDFSSRRFYFFFIEIWPQEVYYITGLLIVAAFVLFLMNAVAGRVWCGYMCPQTVWTDLFLFIERWTEGDRRERMKLDKAPWSLDKLTRKFSKHVLWIAVAWATGGAWVLYFSDAFQLVKDLATGNAPMIAYVWIAILTFTTYALAGFMREQVCIYMCPWPRIQAALTDEWALNVAYRHDRGEPRTSAKKAAMLREKGEAAGDCVDCGQCVVVCPTGTDIRLGSQLSCIQCGLCIDACDTVMKKLDRPTGLIGYDNDMNIHNREAHEPVRYRLIRPRTVIYSALIVGALAMMLFTLTNRALVDVNVLHDRNPLYVLNSDGSIRNSYTVRLLNKASEERVFRLAVEGLPAEARVEVVGGSQVGADGMPVVSVERDRTREVRVSVFMPKGVKIGASEPVVFRLTELKTGEQAIAKDFFKAPGG